MNAAISAEWIYTFATVIPVGLVFVWLLLWHRRTWRRAVWELCGLDIQDVSMKLHGSVAARGWGWCVKLTDKRGEVIWTPGLTAPSTIVRQQQMGRRWRVTQIQGLAPAHWVIGQFTPSAEAEEI